MKEGQPIIDERRSYDDERVSTSDDTNHLQEANLTFLNDVNTTDSSLSYFVSSESTPQSYCKEPVIESEWHVDVIRKVMTATRDANRGNALISSSC